MYNKTASLKLKVHVFVKVLLSQSTCEIRRQYHLISDAEGHYITLLHCFVDPLTAIKPFE